MFEQYTISQNRTILEALRAINNLGKNEALTIFVIDSEGRVCGTLTDGDIRRSLLEGYTLDSCVIDICHKSFSYLPQSGFDVNEIRKSKEKGIELIPILDEQMRIVDLLNLKKRKSYLPVDAVLMAGGRGERLRPLTDKTPKPLLAMNGKPIIDYIVEHVISYGIRNVSVTVNYLKEQLEEHFRNPVDGIMVHTFREPQYLGTLGGIRYVTNVENDTVLLMNSDAITDINLEEFYLHFKQTGADMSVASVPYTVSVPYGILNMDGTVKGIQEKPTFNYYANAGIYLIKRELLELIPNGEFVNATDFLSMLIQKNYKVVSYLLNGTWIDIGNPQEYQKAKELVRHL